MPSAAAASLLCLQPCIRALRFEGLRASPSTMHFEGDRGDRNRDQQIARNTQGSEAMKQGVRAGFGVGTGR